MKTLDDLAVMLYNHLSEIDTEKTWFISVGTGKTSSGYTLFVYVNSVESVPKNAVPNMYENVPVVIRKIPVPLAIRS